MGMVTRVTLERMVGKTRVAVEGSISDVAALVGDLNRAIAQLGTLPAGEPEAAGTIQDSRLPPQLTGVTNATEAITQLFQADWGREPRTISDVREALALNGFHYPLTALSGKLLRLTARGILRRWRDSQGFVYVQGSEIMRAKKW